MRRPIVYLIGTGPGDPSLITVRGLRCLMAADLVLHDRRVDPRLLRYARPDAERIAIQAVAPHTTEHDAICLL
ncbi:MAG: HemD protein, partial [Acidobacteria bacterium]|nr:HemD protein [Acidobacteriota bacterium]